MPKDVIGLELVTRHLHNIDNKKVDIINVNFFLCLILLLFHFAIVRISGFTSMYKDATLITSFVDNNDLNNTTTPLIISQDDQLSDPNCYINGMVSNFRWVKGLGIYTQAGFTVPTRDLTAIASSNPYGGSYTQAIGNGYTKFLLN